MEIENEEEFFPNLHEPITKRGLGAKIILESQIKAAQANAKSAGEAARILGIAYNTYKKYSQLYGIFDDLKNPHGRGISKSFGPRMKKYPAEELLEGLHSEIPLWKYKNKIFASGLVPEVCSCCGYSEKRFTDNKTPIILDFLDGNLENRHIDNVRALCYNCYFLLAGDNRIKIKKIPLRRPYRIDDDNMDAQLQD
jgi:hypothetical protein